MDARAQGEGNSSERPGRERARAVFADALARREAGEPVELEALGLRHPELAQELQRLHANWRRLEGAMWPAREDAPDPAGGDPGERALLERLASGRPASERYRQLGPIARGGMAVVVEVFDEDLGRSAAMKVADLDSVGSEGGRRARRARFLREARVTSRLEHPAIVPVHELGVDREGRPYFTMPRVRGHDLRTVFEWAREGQEGWSETRALGVLLKVCEAVAFAHSRGVVHRDLKPANVMVGRYGEVYVMDWGLARIAPQRELDALDEAEPVELAARHTGEGDVLGTPAYTPPEQAAGRRAEVDERADVYAIGAMLYHLLAGVAPYGDAPGSTSAREAIALVRSGPPTPLARVAPAAAPELLAICERAMAREPAARHADVEALGSDLRAWLEGRVVHTYERGALAELRKWVRRNRATAAALAALAVAGVLLASLGTYAAATRDDVLAAEEQARRARVEAAVEEGFLELGEGDPQAARASFEHALELEPASFEARAGHALALRQAGRPEAALRSLSALPQGSEARAALAPIEAEALRALDRREEAAARDAGAAEPRSFLTAFLAAERELAAAHRGSARRFERAVELHERAVRLSPAVRPLPWYALAHALGHAGTAQRRAEVAEVLETLWPEEPRALHWRAFLLAESDPTGALALFERVAELRPESVATRAGLASVLARCGELERAQEELRRILEARPENVLALTQLAALRRRIGDAEESAALAQRALELRPDDPAAWLELVEARDALAGPERAIATLREALTATGGDAGLRQALALRLAVHGDAGEALSIARALVAQAPDDAPGQAVLARALAAAGDEDGARAARERALELDPLQFVARRAAARACERAGDLEGARRHLQEALRGSPSAATVHYELGRVLYSSGDHEQAVAAYRDALRFQPSLAQAHCNLGLALRALGDFEAALEPLRRGHELGTATRGWPYPSERWIRETEALLEAQHRLDRALADPASVDPVQRAELGCFALRCGRALDALALLEDAVDDWPQDPIDPAERLLGFAARAAARAATDPDLHDALRGELRGRALAWLEQDRLELERRLAEDSLPAGRAAEIVASLLAEPDLESVRAADALARLDEAEAWREHWRALAELAALLAEEGGR